MGQWECTEVESTFTVINACNGEIVVFEGKERSCFEQFTNPAGKIQQRFHNTITGQGIGSFGNEYVVNITQNITFNVNPGQTTEHTNIRNFHVIGKGQAPNFIIKMRIHFTITPDGEMMVSRNITDVECH